MSRRWNPVAATRPAILMFGIAGIGSACAQTLPEVPLAPAAIQPDLGIVRDYYGAVKDRLGSVPAPRERDPFQVTPELRSRRSARAGASVSLPAEVGGAESDGSWRVQALILGPTPRAALVHEPAGGSRANAQERARAGGGEIPRFVREGDALEMPDGRDYRVMRIDREGVLVYGAGAESDWVRIR